MKNYSTIIVMNIRLNGDKRGLKQKLEKVKKAVAAALHKHFNFSIMSGDTKINKEGSIGQWQIIFDKVPTCAIPTFKTAIATAFYCLGLEFDSDWTIRISE